MAITADLSKLLPLGQTYSTNQLYPGSGEDATGAAYEYGGNFANAFSGVDGLGQATINPDGTYTLIRPLEGRKSLRATATVNPDGTVNLGQWKEHETDSFGKTLAQFGLGAAGLFGGAALLGAGPWASGTAAGTGAGAVGGTGLTPSTTGAATGSGLNLGGQAAGSIYGTGAGLGVAPGAVGAATGGTGLGALIGSSIPAGSALAGTALGGAAAGAGSGLANSLFGNLPGQAFGGAATTGTGVKGIPGTTPGGSNPVGNLVGSLLGGQGGGISNLGNLASLFTNYQGYEKFGDLMDKIEGIYSPEGAYAKALEKQLTARDAAGGRGSQYGPRLTELMGSLAGSQAQALQGLGGMLSNQQGYLQGGVGAGQRLFEGLGGLNGLASGLGSLFGGGSMGGMTGSPTMPDISYDIFGG